jgi:predicted nucleic acid-binding protein
MITDKIVIDSSVAIKWFIAQDYSLEANKILDAYQAQQITLIAPDLIYAEIGNIVWKIQRFQGLTNQEAEMILDLFQQIYLQIVSLGLILPKFNIIKVEYLPSVDSYVLDYQVLHIHLGYCVFVGLTQPNYQNFY